MSFQGRHGVRPAERAQPQDFKVDIEVEADLAAAGRTDRLATRVATPAGGRAARGGTEGESRHLRESLASPIAERGLALPRGKPVRVRVASGLAAVSPV